MDMLCTVGGSETAAYLCGRSLRPPDGWILTTGAMKPLWMHLVVVRPSQFPSFHDHVRVKKKKKNVEDVLLKRLFNWQEIWIREAIESNGNIIRYPYKTLDFICALKMRDWALVCMKHFISNAHQ